MTSLLQSRAAWPETHAFLRRLGRDGQGFLRQCLEETPSEDIVEYGIEAAFSRHTPPKIDFGFALEWRAGAGEEQYGLAGHQPSRRLLENLWDAGSCLLVPMSIWEVDSNASVNLEPAGVFFRFKDATSPTAINGFIQSVLSNFFVAGVREVSPGTLALLNAIVAVKPRLRQVHIGQMLGRKGAPWVGTFTMTSVSDLKQAGRVFPQVSSQFGPLSRLLSFFLSRNFKCLLSSVIDEEGETVGLEFALPRYLRSRDQFAAHATLLSALDFETEASEMLDVWLSEGRFLVDNPGYGHVRCLNHGKVSLQKGTIVARKLYMTVIRSNAASVFR